MCCVIEENHSVVALSIAPKGQQNIAQGIALGKRMPSPPYGSALKGQQNILRAPP